MGYKTTGFTKTSWLLLLLSVAFVVLGGAAYQEAREKDAARAKREGIALSIWFGAGVAGLLLVWFLRDNVPASHSLLYNSVFWYSVHVVWSFLGVLAAPSLWVWVLAAGILVEFGECSIPIENLRCNDWTDIVVNTTSVALAKAFTQWTGASLS